MSFNVLESNMKCSCLKSFLIHRGTYFSSIMQWLQLSSILSQASPWATLVTLLTFLTTTPNNSNILKYCSTSLADVVMMSVLAARRMAGMAQPMARAMSLARPEERVTATLIPGDGVGPELVASMEEVFRAISVPVDFEVFFLSEVHAALSTPIDTVVDSITRNGLCLKGVLTTPSVSATGEADTLNIRLRNQLDLYANVVKVQSVEGVRARHGPAANPPSDPIDLVVIR